MATYSKSSNLVFHVLIYLLKFDLIRYMIILQDAIFCSSILFAVELLIYGLSEIYFIKSPTYLKLVKQ